MRCAGAQLGSCLGGADVEAAVNLIRIGADDFAAEDLRQRDSGIRLAGRRGTDDRDQRACACS